MREEKLTLPTTWISPAQAPMDKDDSSDSRPTWWMRRNLELDEIRGNITFSIVCLGYYELWVNGTLISEEPLAPSLTRMSKRGFCIAYDITDHLQAGANCIALWCSSGWYLPSWFDIHEGMTPAVALRVVDAKGRTLCESDKEWMCRESNRYVIGPWKWNKFGGEEVDARAYLPGWNQSGCVTTDWHSVTTISAPPISVTARTCPENRVGETYTAQSIRELEGGVFEVDFGTCLAGWVDIDFPDLSPGQTVTMRFFDLPADNDRERDHSYGQISVYHARGDGADRFVNKFNYAGFRYVTIEGVDEAPPLDAMEALLVETAMEQTGSFKCSNELFNLTHALNLHTLRCLDLGGYSVDCPHRERKGYGADGQSALPAYLYMLDSHAFLSKWLTDWCDCYDHDTGQLPWTAPASAVGAAPAWSGIVVPLAWHLHLYFGDSRPMKEAFVVIQGHLRHLQTFVKDGLMSQELWDCLGDWVPPGRGVGSRNNPNKAMNTLFNSCYLIYVWELFIKICNVIGHDSAIAEAQTNISALREGIHREFYVPEQGIYLMPEQAYQAMPLLTGVVPEELRGTVQKKLVDLIAAKGWHMDTGLPGTTLLLDLLQQMDEHDVISRIYSQETYPSWGYMLAQGATAIWEEWNGYWSQIHSCFAGPASWFYSGLAGIRPDESGPGFKRFMLAPAFVAEVDSVEASYASANGLIRSAWQRKGKAIEWSATVPEGSQATVRLPVHDSGNVTLDGRPFVDESPRPDDKSGDALCFSLSPGEHLISFIIETNREQSGRAS